MHDLTFIFELKKEFADWFCTIQPALSTYFWIPMAQGQNQ